MEPSISCVKMLLLYLTALVALAVVSADRGEGEDALQNIRIVPHYHSSVESLPDAKQTLIKDVLINATLSWLSAVLKVRPEADPLTFEQSCSAARRKVRGTWYCVGTCSQNTLCGPVPIPEEHLKPCRSCVGDDCRVSPRQPEGVAEADLVLYVSAVSDPVKCRSSLVYGGHCQQERLLDRPVAAYLNLCPAYLVASHDYYHLQIASVVHEMIHALAFSDSLFPYFRDENGNPRTQRDAEGFPLRNQYGAFRSDGTVRYHSYVPWEVADSVRASTNESAYGPPVVHKVMVVTTPNVVREVQDHFNCSRAVGAELESQGGDGIASNYWEKRVFGEELMTAAVSYHPILSRITLALLHDSGWYLPDYSYGGQLEWGRGRGCDFVEGSCYKWVGPRKEDLEEREDADEVPFCGHQQVGLERCVEQRRAIGVCNIKNYRAKLPEEYRYYSTDRKGGTSPLVDYCPIFQYDMYNKIGRNCLQPPNGDRILPEHYGPDSRCFEHKWTVTGRGGGEVGSGAGCYSYKCSGQRVFVMVEGEELRCRQAGQKKTVQYTFNNVTYRGRIVCPDYDELCGDYSCPGLCSGHGRCDNGYCRCESGYHGEDCSRSYYERLLSCDDVTCHNGGSCLDNQTTSGYSCVCEPGFTGALCEQQLVPDPCQGKLCSGNGACHRFRMGTVGKCVCYPGYEGEDCETFSLCEMRGSPCNHGQCVLDNTTGDPVCQCEAGYSGQQCQHINHCLSQPCQRGGTCHNVPSLDTFNCSCPDNYTGIVCELDDPCASSPCHNGGTCISRLERGRATFDCVCPLAFKGERCGNRKNPCRPNPCANGGQCVLERGELHDFFHCQCQSGFTGEMCEITHV